MTQLTVRLNPKHIIKTVAFASESYLINQFMEVISKLYQYELFKPFMDLVATKAYEKNLKFKITPKEAYHLDEGNCKTIEANVFNKLLNKLVARKDYSITIRKISPDIIIHEIGHMVEKEAGLKLDRIFYNAVTQDIAARHYSNVSLGAAVRSVMIQELEKYPTSQLHSELFTRYFQLLAMSNEVSGKDAEYKFDLSSVYKAFPATEQWILDNLHKNKNLAAKYNLDIVKASEEYLIPLTDIKHKWSDEKIKPFHKDKGKVKWAVSIKSIKGD